MMYRYGAIHTGNSNFQQWNSDTNQNDDDNVVYL
jgi:hypothetical protein